MEIKGKKSSPSKRENSASDEIPDELPVKSFAKMTRHRSFVFYGRAGTGKTTLGLTFPGKVLWLDVRDKGTDSVSDIPEEEGVCMEIDTWEDFEMVYYYLKKWPKKYATVGIDTMSQLQTLAVEYVLRKKKKNVDRAGDWGTMTRKEWGEVAQLMKEWIINFRDLKMEVIFVAQDRVFNQDEDNDDTETLLKPEIGPRLSPSIASHINAAVSVVGNTFIRRREITKEVNGKKKLVMKTDYCLRIGPDPLYATKARKPKGYELPGIIVDPTYDKIIKILQGED